MTKIKIINKLKIIFALLIIQIIILPLNINHVYADSAETVFIGDSRATEMQQAVGTENGTRWITKNGAVYSWIQRNIPSTSSLKQESEVVFMVGIDDLAKASKYAQLINSKAKEWKSKGIKVYFVSVNPIDTSLAQKARITKTNEAVEKFNQTMRDELSDDVTYIDTYSKISDSFVTQNGVNYNNNTNQNIYNEIKKNIGTTTTDNPNGSNGGDSNTDQGSNKTASNDPTSEEGNSSLWDDVMHYTIEDIIYNRIPFFDVNVFSKTAGGKEINENSIVDLIRKISAIWYISFRNLALVILTILLIYAGIRLAMTTIASEKARYKDVLIGWLKSLILILVVHYIMVGILNMNEILVGIFSKVNQEEGTLYDTLWSRALQRPVAVSIPATIMFLSLVLLYLRFCYAYVKRLFYVILLILLAPVVIAEYAFGVVSGKRSTNFMEWVKNFASNVMIQSIHAMAYTAFGTIAVNAGTQNFRGLILALFMLRFLLLADDIFLNIFKFNFGSKKPASEMQKSFELKKQFRELVWFSSISKSAIGLAKNGAGGINRFVAEQAEQLYNQHMDNKFDKTGETKGILDSVNNVKNRIDNALIDKLENNNGTHSNNRNTRQNQGNKTNKINISTQAANLLRLRKLSRIKGNTGRQAKKAYKLKTNYYKKKFTGTFKLVTDVALNGGKAVFAIPTMVINPELGAAMLFDTVATATATAINIDSNKENKENEKKYNESLDQIITSLAITDENLDTIAERLDALEPDERQETMKKMKKYIKFSSFDIESRVRRFVKENKITKVTEQNVSDIVNHVISGIAMEKGMDFLNDLDLEPLKSNITRIINQNINSFDDDNMRPVNHTENDIVNETDENNNQTQPNQTQPNQTQQNQTQQNQTQSGQSQQGQTQPGQSQQNQSQPDSNRQRTRAKSRRTRDEENTNSEKESIFSFIADAINDEVGKDIAGNKFAKPIKEIQKINRKESGKENSNGEVVDLNRFLDNL